MQIAENVHILQLGGNKLYLIVSQGEALLIDSYVASGEEQVLDAIREEGVDPSQLRIVLLTHADLDHVGANHLLRQRTPARFAIHVNGAGLAEDIWYQFQERLCRFLSPTPERYESFRNTTGKGVQMDILLRDGDVIGVGDYEMEVIHTPGHSPGSVCLYHRPTKALYTGDTFVFMLGWFGLIVDGVSFWQSINRIAEMEVDLFLPAHGEIQRGSAARKEITDCIERFRKAEQIVLEALREHDGLHLAEVKDLAGDRMIGGKRTSDSDQELYTTNAMLQKLCYEGKAVLERGLIWKAT